jgi:Suppressor of fused protein (SUFU)
MRFLAWFKSLVKNKGTVAESPDAKQELAQVWQKHKSALLEKKFGKEHDMVMHAFVPYAIGGPLALFYFPNGIPGTAIVTKELSELPNQGPSNALFRSYEMVMFTKHGLSLDDATNDQTPFGRAHSNINAILNTMARYSETAKLNPFETAEFPEDMETIGGKCLIFDPYARYSDNMVQNFGLLAIIEIFRPEMEYAMKHGGLNLIKKLKEKGCYPYSDLDREPVV